MFRLTLNSGYTASQERITVVSRGLPVHQSYESKLKKVLNINFLEDQANNDQIWEDKNSLNSIVNQIKSKIHNKETIRAEKLQILTLVPSEWSRKKSSKNFWSKWENCSKSKRFRRRTWSFFFFRHHEKVNLQQLKPSTKYWSFIKTTKIAEYYQELKTELVSKRMYINKSD